MAFNASTRSLAVIGGLLASISAPGWAAHSWAGMHWSRNTILTLRLGDNVSTAWDPYLATASVDWTSAAKIDTLIYFGARTPSSCNPTYGKIEICSYAYGASGWLGLASVWTQYGHIVQGTVKLNDTYFNSLTYNTPAWRRMVMCQEIGHTFGLDHQDEIHTNTNLGSCMDYTSDPSGLKGTNGTKNNEHPNAHDFEQLSTIYAHYHWAQLSTTKATTSGFAGQMADVSGAAQPNAALADAGSLQLREWGRAIAVDRRGRGRVFVRSLGGGAEVTTFVLWADPLHR